MSVWWIVARRACVRAVTNDAGIITDAAPLVRVFIGQPLANLQYFMHRRFGGLVSTELSVSDPSSQQPR